MMSGCRQYRVCRHTVSLPFYSSQITGMFYLLVVNCTVLLGFWQINETAWLSEPKTTAAVNRTNYCSPHISTNKIQN